MIRPAIIATCALGILGAGVGTALAHTSTTHRADHQVCVVLAKDPNHQHTQDYCVDWGSALGQR